ncbi:MAG: Fe-S-containing protein [Treponema sp.]|jgi:uncharacterized membrane protein|nr:Fe-S-containing protein [Treponema sp.]
MLKYLIQVVQNALPGAIPLSLLYAVSYGSGGEGRKRLMLWGGIAGTAAALILALLRTYTRLVNREYINTAVLALAIAAGVFFILLTAGWPKGRARFRERASGWAGAFLAALFLFYTLPGILLYIREVVPPGESAFSTAFLFRLAGYMAGLLVVALSALSLFRAGKDLPSRPVKILLSAVLAVSMLSHLSVIIQFLLARRIIRVPRWLFRIVVLVINNNVIFLYALMGISLLLPLFLFIRSLRITESWRNPAEHRKLRAFKRGHRRWSAVAVSSYLAALLALTVLKTWSERGVTLSPAEPMTILGDQIVIPIEKIDDWHLHRYNYTASENIEMRFIVIRKNEAAYGVGLDACDICGPTGYYERRDGVVCRLCDVVMNISTIGFKGGCNPVPLAYTMREGNMVIRTADLEAERGRFK